MMTRIRKETVERPEDATATMYDDKDQKREVERNDDAGKKVNITRLLGGACSHITLMDKYFNTDMK